MSTSFDSRFQREAAIQNFTSEEFDGTIEPVNSAGVYVARLVGKKLGTTHVLQNRSKVALLDELNKRLRYFKVLRKDTRSEPVRAIDQQVATAKQNMIAAGEGRARVYGEVVPQAPAPPQEFGSGVSNSEREAIANAMWEKFLIRHPEYLTANNSNIAVTLQEMGWSRTSENYERAWQYLVQNNMLIKPLKRGERMIQAFSPPRQQQAMVQNEQEDLKQLKTMPLDQLRAQVDVERKAHKQARRSVGQNEAEGVQSLRTMPLGDLAAQVEIEREQRKQARKIPQ
jgi:hypothetical protein